MKKAEERNGTQAPRNEQSSVSRSDIRYATFHGATTPGVQYNATVAGGARLMIDKGAQQGACVAAMLHFY